MKKLDQKAWKVKINQPKPEMTTLNATLENSKHSDTDYVHFVHASLGFPAPTTFMNAARKGFINGTNKYTRLTSKLVAKHMPNAMATARGHLERKPASQPHSASQAVSALSSTSFDPTTVARSQTLHMDYTGRLQTICTSGTEYLQIACWGHYINIQPLTSLRSAQTTQAFTNSVNFFRDLGVSITQLRMDNQWSEDLRDAARDLDITIEFISAEAKRANRAERAIRTAKNHIIATRAGFHPDFSHAFLDKCLPQMELALNIIHPFEYDNSISSYEGIHRAKFDFKRHPFAPPGCKVLTQDRMHQKIEDHGRTMESKACTSVRH